LNSVSHLATQMAYARLRNSITKGNLWLYMLTELETGGASPRELRERVKERFGVTAASITFYSVIYRLRKEGLVRKSTNDFRSAYEVTPKGKSELEKARRLLREVGGWIDRASRAPEPP
jgi:DNA-binding PadR family transcriptional regulator